MPKPKAPLCPSCTAPMTLARVIPRLGGMVELHTFECKLCAVAFTQAAEDR